ncbi:MAG TPA: hypothetical protein VH599_07920 [Ktedonobacterales bacterium]|jgi:hypothetical protein
MDRRANTLRVFIEFAAAQASLTNLFISLAFGVGQVIVGAAMIRYTTRKARWRRGAFFGLALLGAWIATSGLTELVVSGTEMLARLGGNVSAATAEQIRANADTAFLAASLALLVVGAGYLLLARRWAAQRKTDR